jgi:hypothetical protein
LVLYVLTGRPRLDKLWLTLVVYLGLAASCFAVGLLVNKVFPVERTAVAESLYVFDLAALSTAKNENLFPFPLSDAELQAVKTCYGDGSRADPFIWGACKFVWTNAGAIREQNRRAVARAWRSAILHAPHLYLAARFKYFGAFLAVTRPPQEYVWLPGFAPNTFGFPEKIEGVYALLGDYVEAFRQTALFRPWLWLALALFVQLALLAAERGSVTGRMIFTTGLVSVGYLLTFLPFSAAADFRYCNLAIALTSFALLGLLAAVERRLRNSPSDEGYSLRSIFGGDD